MSMPNAAPHVGHPAPARPWYAVSAITLGVTWLLMMVGSLTRASQAGLACPDWPLCHGYLVPPLDARALPANAAVAIQQVWLEFLHRVLALIAGAGAIALSVAAWRTRHRVLATSLTALVVLQIAMGAVTVWLGNAPATVVAHLALALGLLSLLLVAHRTVFARTGALLPSAPGALVSAYLAVLALMTLQLLLGAAVSAGHHGLACSQFPFCDSDGLLPDDWTRSAAWQMAHRGLGTLLFLLAIALLVATVRRPTPQRDRRLVLVVASGILAQGLLGGANVWLRLAPAVSAIHLGLAVLLFLALVDRLLETRPWHPRRRHEPLPVG